MDIQTEAVVGATISEYDAPQITGSPASNVCTWPDDESSLRTPSEWQDLKVMLEVRC